MAVAEKMERGKLGRPLPAVNKQMRLSAILVLGSMLRTMECRCQVSFSIKYKKRAGRFSKRDKPDSVPCRPQTSVRRRPGHSFICRTNCPALPDGRRGTPGTITGGPPGPLFCLAPEWVYLAPSVTLGAVGSYPTFSPLPFHQRLWVVPFGAD